MFKLIPCVLILLMISRKGNYFDAEDFELLNGLPSEYLKTNSFVRKTQSQMEQKLVRPKRPRLVDLRRHITTEIYDQIKKSDVAFFVHLDEEQEDELKEFFVN